MKKRIDLFIRNLKVILTKEKIEVLNDKNDSDRYIGFLFNNIEFSINKNGFLDYKTLNNVEISYINKLIYSAQILSGIERVSPLSNFEISLLDCCDIGGVEFIKIMQFGNICLCFRPLGLLGFEYCVCEKTKVDNNYIFSKCNFIDNLEEAEIVFNGRANLHFTATAYFSDKEILASLHFIKNAKIDRKYFEKNEMFKNDFDSFVKRASEYIKAVDNNE